MRRREFIRLFSSTVVAWPLTARAQAAMPVIGFLSSGTFENNRDYVAAFHRGLADGGFAEAAIQGLSTDGQRVTTIGYLHWLRIWLVVR